HVSAVVSATGARSFSAVRASDLIWPLTIWPILSILALRMHFASFEGLHPLLANARAESKCTFCLPGMPAPSEWSKSVLTGRGLPIMPTNFRAIAISQRWLLALIGAAVLVASAWLTRAH